MRRRAEGNQEFEHGTTDAVRSSRPSRPVETAVAALHKLPIRDATIGTVAKLMQRLNSARRRNPERGTQTVRPSVGGRPVEIAITPSHESPSRICSVSATVEAIKCL